MTTDSMTQLERDAQQHRSGLADAVSHLVRAINPDRLGQEAVEQAAATGRSAAEAAVKAAKDNPAGLALIGIGAALLLTNRSHARHASVPPQDAMEGQAARIASADRKMQHRDRIATGQPRPGVSSSKMRQLLDAGLDKLGPDARDRVIAVRLKAIDAQEAIERHARNAKQSAIDAHQSQPFATGLAVAGIGALIGALLPSTRKEAELLGAKRDQLFRAAESVLREELATLEARGKSAVQAAIDHGTEELRRPTAAE